jgi:hypothetical protein
MEPSGVFVFLPLSCPFGVREIGVHRAAYFPKRNHQIDAVQFPLGSVRRAMQHRGQIILRYILFALAAGAFTAAVMFVDSIYRLQALVLKEPRRSARR